MSRKYRVPIYSFLLHTVSSVNPICISKPKEIVPRVKTKPVHVSPPTQRDGFNVRDLLRDTTLSKLAPKLSLKALSHQLPTFPFTELVLLFFPEPG